jgi:predicted RNA-binding protein
MDLTVEYGLFEKKVDSETGSILFYRKDMKGIPDKVIEGDGFTVEIKNDKVFAIDIFNSQKVLGNLLKTLRLKKTA